MSDEEKLLQIVKSAFKTNKMYAAKKWCAGLKVLSERWQHYEDDYLGHWYESIYKQAFEPLPGFVKLNKQGLPWPQFLEENPKLIIQSAYWHMSHPIRDTIRRESTLGWIPKTLVMSVMEEIAEWDALIILQDQPQYID